MKKILQALFTGSSKKESEDRRRPRRLRRQDPAVILRGFLNSIEESGYKRIKVSTLIKKFGYKKRSTKNLLEVNEFLSSNNLFVFPKLTLDTPWNSRLQISDFPETALGDIFDTEKEMEDYIDEKGALKQLSIDLSQVTRQYSHSRASGKMDFCAKVNGVYSIVIELKRRTGEKKAVEQVDRYSGILMSGNKDLKVRKILITGIRDKSTALAIFGGSQEKRENFEWYLYNWDKEKDTIGFELVSMKEIQKYWFPQDFSGKV